MIPEVKDNGKLDFTNKQVPYLKLIDNVSTEVVKEITLDKHKEGMTSDTDLQNKTKLVVARCYRRKIVPVFRYMSNSGVELISDIRDESQGSYADQVQFLTTNTEGLSLEVTLTY